MAGLLDMSFFSTPEAQAGLGLLAAGGGNMGNAIKGMLEQQQAAEERRLRREQQMLQQKYVQSQISENEMQALARRSQIEAAQRKQAALPALYGSMPGAMPQQEGGQMQGQQQAQGRPQLDWQAALRAGYSPDEIQKLASLTNLGREEVARTMKGIGPGGREYEYQVDKYGNRVGEGMAQFRAPIMQDLGNKVVALDPYTLQQQQALGKTMTPDAAANYGLSAQRLAMDRDKAAFEREQGGKPAFNADAAGFIVPPSEKNPAGTIIPLPGFQKPLNDVQSKSLLFGSRMNESDKIINDLAKSGKDFSTPGAAAPYGIGSAINLVNPEQAQMLDQAKRDFLNATLRRESGAVIAKEEFSNADKQYFPQIGDSQKTIEQKARNRALAIQGVMAEVPKGIAPLTGVRPIETQQPPSNRPIPPQAAINDLKMRGPKAKAQFDAIFGEGAADRALGGR